MLRIKFFPQPQPEDYGFSKDEIPVIEAFEIKPKKKALHRDSVIETIAYVIFYLSIYLSFFLSLYKKHGFSAITFVQPLGVIIMLTFLFIIPLIASSIISSILKLIIPVSVLHDREAIYVGKNLEMKKKKEALEKYRMDEKEYQKKTEELRKKYPGIEKFVRDDYSVSERKYVKEIVNTYFYSTFKNRIEKAEKREKERKQKDWWRNLSPDDFENEVGEWYKRKGYNVKVTRFVDDGGIDVIANKNGSITYIQCKHYNGKIGPNFVRELYGVMSADNITNGAIVCLDGVTSGAKDFADKNGIEILTLEELARHDVGVLEYVKQYEDIGKALKYGDFYFIYEGWNTIDDAMASIRGYEPRDGKAYGLYRCYEFYLSVFSDMTRLNLIQSDLAYIVDAKDFQVIYDSKKDKINQWRSPSINKHYQSKKKRYY